MEKPNSHCRPPFVISRSNETAHVIEALDTVFTTLAKWSKEEVENIEAADCKRYKPNVDDLLIYLDGIEACSHLLIGIADNLRLELEENKNEGKKNEDHNQPNTER